MIHFIGQFDPIWHTERYVADAFEWWGEDCQCYDINSVFDRPGRNGNPAVRPRDIVLISQPHRFSEVAKRAVGRLAQLDEWRAGGAKLVCWYFDWIQDYVDAKGEDRAEAYLPALEKFDLILSTDGYDSGWYEQRGLTRRWLPQGAPQDAQPIRHRPAADYSVLFIGSCYTAERQALLDRLKPYGVVVANGRAGARIWGAEMARLCGSSAIVVGDNFRNDVPGYWSDRVYQVLAYGGFFLTPAVPGLDNHFKDGQCLVTYTGLDDLEDKVKFWLKAGGARGKIAMAGSRMVRMEHTYLQRARELLDMVADIGKAKPKPVDAAAPAEPDAVVEVKPEPLRIGLLGYTNRTSGLGNVNYDLSRHLPIDSILSPPTYKGQETWRENQVNARGHRLTRDTVIHYFERYHPRVLLAVETTYNNEVSAISARYKCKLVIIPMHEVYRPGDVRADLWLCPNRYSYDKVEEPCKMLFPLPIGAEDFKFEPRKGRATRFLHSYGYGFINNKRQLDKVIAGFRALPNQDVTLTISTQIPLPDYGYPVHPDPRIRFRDENHTPADAYRDMDVLIQPEAYAGYGRATLEAMLCGLPVITTDAPPMNEIVTDGKLLIRPESSEPFNAAPPFNAIYNAVGKQGVKAALERAMDMDLAKASRKARKTAERHMWTQRKTDKLMKVLKELAAA